MGCDSPITKTTSTLTKLLWLIGDGFQALFLSYKTILSVKLIYFFGWKVRKGVAIKDGLSNRLSLIIANKIDEEGASIAELKAGLKMLVNAETSYKLCLDQIFLA
ncbi:hypothetical protein LR48_Vigan62s001400 [Vigna angularis]|uniref:Uncharacterized protein n=1 Tax=Phaseolus angularis TaxID=3914 RepID=A0A0L9T3T2_PHAAN|nr:hypothetical protein LR48_Vigan62s001400 [Vigna angularis]